jgi:hypothetical protein
MSARQQGLRVLSENKYALTENTCGVEVVIDHPHRIQDIVLLLTPRGIDSEVGDIVHEVYQG